MSKPPFMSEAEHRYHHDAEYRSCVDVMYAMALKHQFTPAELREMAFMAALKYEMTHGFKKLTIQVSREEYERLRSEGVLGDPLPSYSELNRGGR